MTPERFRDLREQFDRLLTLPPQDRAIALHELSSHDPDLGYELSRLLTARESGTWIAIFKRQNDGSMKLWRSIASDGPAPKPEAG